MSSDKPAGPGPGKMPQVAIGDPPRSVSRFCLGGFHQLEISSEIVAEVVDAFLAEGGNYIETARSYGSGASEEKLGRALAGRRDQVTLTSKTGAKTADEARRDIERSLRALQTDHLDFCFFHGVDGPGLGRICAPGGALEAFVEAREQGTIGGFGLSSHTPQTYLDAYDRLPLSLILVWLNYLDNFNFPIIPAKVIPEARRRGVAVTAMKPLADGFLRRSPSAAIRYCLGSGADVAVCGANTVEHVRQIAEAVRSGPADDAEKREILKTAPELGRYVCRRCGQCPPQLMELFRLEGMADRQMIDYLPHGPAERALRKVLSKWFDHTKTAQAEYQAGGFEAAGLTAMAQSVQCPYDIDVPRKTRLTLAKLTESSADRV